MIELIRSFVGTAPALSSIYDIPAFTEWIFGAGLLFLVIASVYAVFGNIISFFRR